MSAFRHKLTKRGPRWYQIQMRAAGETIGIMKAGGVWVVMHPRLAQNDSLPSFRAARQRALDFAKLLDGAA